MQIYADKLFENPIEIIEAFNNKEFSEAFKKIENYRKTHYLTGYIRYEAKDIFLNKKIVSKLPLLYFEVFENYKDFIPEKVEQDILLSVKPCISPRKYKENILKIKDYIANGETYQVNYTYDCNIDFKGKSIDLYNYLLTKQKTPYNAFFQNKYEKILSFSPELFFTLKNNIITTKPMKGTVKRGENQKQDKKNIEFLKNDIKNRAENIMIVDLLRNDLGKIAKTGTVKVTKLFEIETHPSVHQMTSQIQAELNEETTLFEIFNAISPCGSITGAPKINTMKIIEELESNKREVYCGAIGFISPEETVFSVPIRILQKQNCKKYYKYYVGGAIVWDSTAKDEWEETLTKTKFLSNDIDFELVETIKVKNKKLIYKNLHLKRLKNSAKQLGFKFNPQILNIKPEKDGILRILLNQNGNYKTEYLPLNEIKSNKIALSPKNIQSSNPFLKHKTTYRPWYKTNYEKIKNDLIYDEIFFNEKGEITEGTRTNIVIKKNGNMFTPPIKSGILNGVMRQKLITQGKLKEKTISVKELQNADEIYCINSVRGIKKVTLK